MTSAHDPIPQDVRDIILARLDGIERNHDVRILFAIESGSRAWGFPSPDSDYDVRFVYVRPRQRYLTVVETERDVIELPIEGDLDINGWDLRKALALLIKPNPVLLEWLRSPIVYRADADAMARLTALGEQTAYLRPSRYHYLRLAEPQYRRYVAGRDKVRLKKYLYVVRPVLALRWLRLHPDRPVPMHLAALRDGADLPDAASRSLDAILARKAATKELGTGRRDAALDTLIEEELGAAQASDNEPAEGRADLLVQANDLFRDLVGSS